MGRFLLELFGFSLILTILIEGFIAWLLGMRGRRQLLLVLLVNILTNPAAVLLIWMIGLPQLPVELCVVAVEFFVYRSFRKGMKMPQPMLLALVCNGISWGLGLLIQSL